MGREVRGRKKEMKERDMLTCTFQFRVCTGKTATPAPSWPIRCLIIIFCPYYRHFISLSNRDLTRTHTNTHTRAHILYSLTHSIPLSLSLSLPLISHSTNSSPSPFHGVSSLHPLRRALSTTSSSPLSPSLSSLSFAEPTEVTQLSFHPLRSQRPP